MTDGVIDTDRGPASRRLVGRARELDAILRALTEVEQGRGKLIVLAGEPGIWESGGAPAYFPWLGVLSSMAASLDDLRAIVALTRERVRLEKH